MEVNEDLPALLEEQRREVAAAEAAEYDLLFAFQLQMEEVMINSLPKQKNAASTSRLTFYDDDVIHNNTVSHLFAEELAKYEQQVHDCQKAEAEMKKVEDDLNRRIHDQAFAKEILNVPEGQWKKTGDHLQRPYGGEGSSKGGVATLNGEYFRVYVKGLTGEDAEDVIGVNDGRNLAGIGVAVCDPSGILVFEVSKNLTGSTGEILTDEIVELKALIEGLDVAIMLGLKRVSVYLDSQTILQYVSLLDPRLMLLGLFKQCCHTRVGCTIIEYLAAVYIFEESEQHSLQQCCSIFSDKLDILILEISYTV